MTIEDKAKHYDEALEIAKKNYITAQDLCEGSKIGVECFKNTLESIFPEIKEIENDKIRKELTEFLKKASGGFLDSTIECKTFGKWHAWLEKQGKDKEINNFDVLPDLYKCVHRMFDDEHPKSPWISVKDDLPCNHKELLLSIGYHTVTVFTYKKVVLVVWII